MYILCYIMSCLYIIYFIYICNQLYMVIDEVAQNVKPHWLIPISYKLCKVQISITSMQRACTLLLDISKQYLQSILYLSKLFMGNCKYLAANTLVLSITLVFLCNTEYCIGKQLVASYMLTGKQLYFSKSISISNSILILGTPLTLRLLNRRCI